MIHSSNVLAIEGAIKVKALSRGSAKVAIKSALEVVVYNFETRSVDFKVKLWREDTLSEMTCSMGWMAINRRNHSLLIHFDSVAKEDDGDSPMRHSSKLMLQKNDSFVSWFKFNLQTNQIVTFYDLLKKFEHPYRDLFPKPA